jgi:hypothetical protein
MRDSVYKSVKMVIDSEVTWWQNGASRAMWLCDIDIPSGASVNNRLEARPCNIFVIVFSSTYSE